MTVFEACQYSSQDDGFILAKAAKIISKDLFEKYVSFDGDLSINKAESNYPSSLKRLIMMILDSSAENITSSKTNKIANNISQIIRFDAIKHKCRGHRISSIGLVNIDDVIGCPMSRG